MQQGALLAMDGLTEFGMKHARVRAEALADHLGGCTRGLMAARLRYMALLHPYDAPRYLAEATRLDQEIQVVCARLTNGTRCPACLRRAGAEAA